MTVLQYHRLPVLAHQHRQITFLLFLPSVSRVRWWGGKRTVLFSKLFARSMGCVAWNCSGGYNSLENTRGQDSCMSNMDLNISVQMNKLHM